jgi:hypothetical protein
VTGAGPDLVAVIPRDITTAVRADTTDRVKFTFGISVDSDVLAGENRPFIPG